MQDRELEFFLLYCEDHHPTKQSKITVEDASMLFAQRPVFQIGAQPVSVHGVLIISY